MARKKQEPKTVAGKIEQVCKDALLDKDKPSRQYIKKFMAEKYDYTNEANINKELGLMVKSGKLIQEGQTFYAKGFKPEPEPEEWTPLPTNKKHCPRSEGYHSEGFPKAHQSEIEGSDERSFWKLTFQLYQLGIMYMCLDDESRGKTFGIAWQNMLDCSNHNYEDTDKYGNYIGIGHEDMSSNMVANDVKCLRDIHGVGASVVKLIEEWIETGKLKRLEDLKKTLTPSALKDIESFDEEQEDDFEAKLEKLRIVKQEKVKGVRVKVDDIVVVVNKKTVRYTDDFVDMYEDYKTIASVLKEHVKNTDAHKTDVIWECSCQRKKFEFVFHQDHDGDVEFKGDVPEDIDEQELEEVLTEELVHPIMYEEEPKFDIFETKKDFMPDFLEALGKLATLYEKEDDFRATSFRRAIIALEGQIITAVEDIKLFNLIELRGVGKSTLMMLEEFITSGKIEKLEEKRPTDHAKWFASLTEDQKEYMKDWWDSEGETKHSFSNGVAFTFEYNDKEYKVEGGVEEHEWEGALHGLTFEGNMYIKGKLIGTVNITDNAVYFGDDDNGCEITLAKDKVAKDELGERIEDECFEAFHTSVFESGIYSFAYRE